MKRSLPFLEQVWPHVADSQSALQRQDSSSVDIVGIHGLDTNGERTWVAYKEEGNHCAGETHWLRDADMLPSKIPEARIFTYDWDADTLLDAAQATLEQHAHIFLDKLTTIRHNEERYRPLLFIASCYGGLLLAKAMELAAPRYNQYHEIMSYVVGIITLGTPFGGSSAVGMARTQICFARWFGYSPWDKLIRLVDQRNDEIESLVQRFREIVDGQQIQAQCFFETKSTNVLRKILPTPIADFWLWKGYFSQLIVDPKGADAHLSKRRALGLYVRHAMLNKYRNPNDAVYQTVSGCVKEFARSATDRRLIKRQDKNQLSGVFMTKDDDLGLTRCLGSPKNHVGSNRAMRMHPIDNAKLFMTIGALLALEPSNLPEKPSWADKRVVEWINSKLQNLHESPMETREQHLDMPRPTI